MFTVEQLEEAMQKVMDAYAGGIGSHYQFNEKQLKMADEKIRQLQTLAENVNAEDMHELMFVYEQNDETEIDLLEIYYLLKAKLKWLILAFVIGGF